MATQQFKEIAENFAFLDDWEDRYRYVIELGKEMPELDAAKKIQATKVDGCASQVWIVPELSADGVGAPIRFAGDSDALIVRGLIAILLTLFDGKTATEILRVDAPAELARLGLDQHLSAQRSNGLKAMINRIRDIANAAQGAA